MYCYILLGPNCLDFVLAVLFGPGHSCTLYSYGFLHLCHVQMTVKGLRIESGWCQLGKSQFFIPSYLFPSTYLIMQILTNPLLSSCEQKSLEEGLAAAQQYRKNPCNDCLSINVSSGRFCHCWVPILSRESHCSWHMRTEQRSVLPTQQDSIFVDTNPVASKECQQCSGCKSGGCEIVAVGEKMRVSFGTQNHDSCLNA